MCLIFGHSHIYSVFLRLRKNYLSFSVTFFSLKRYYKQRGKNTLSAKAISEVFIPKTNVLIRILKKYRQ